MVEELDITQEDKELLLKDLCARQPYGVKVQYNNEIYDIDYISALYEEVHLDIPDNYTIGISEIKPYLRPMSNMTEEERDEYNKTRDKIAVQWDEYGQPIGYEYINTIKTFDWLNKHHFDYRGLISMGLALEAPEGMYTTT